MTHPKTLRVGKVTLYLRGSVWYLRYHDQHRRRQVRAGPDKDAARRLAAQVNGQLENGIPAATSFELISLADLQRRWLKHHEHVLRPSVATINRYRVVVVRKNLAVEKGERVLFDDVRYFFYLTNITDLSLAEIVPLANDRGDQENLIQQLKSGVQAMKMPVDNPMSNWAYPGAPGAALAWSVKAWLALALPETPGHWRERHATQKRQLLTMDFKTFLAVTMRLPCPIVKTGRRIVYRLLAWDPWQGVFLRLVETVHRPLLR